MRNRLSKQTQAQLKIGLIVALQAAEKCLEGLPIPGVQGCISGILRLIEQEDLRKANMDTFKGLADRIHGIITFIDDRTSNRKDKRYISESLMQNLVEFTSELRDIPDQYRKDTQSTSLRRRIRDFVSAGEHAELLNNLAQQLENSITNFHTKSVLNIQIEAQKSKVEAAQQRLADERYQNEEKERAETRRIDDERQDEIRKLKKSVEEKAFWDAHREFPTRLCAEGTREKLLDTVAKWAGGASPDKRPFLWLNGRAGMGKSTIAKTLAARFDAEGTLGASFMFSRPNGVTDGSKVSPTLAYQLARHLKDFRDRLADTLKTKDGSISAEIPRQFQDLLAVPLNQLPAHQPFTVIIIDALDECTEGTIEPLLSSILGNMARFDFLRIIVTSRPESSIREAQRSFSEHVYNLDLHDISADEDVRVFLQSELKALYCRLKPRTAPYVTWPASRELELLGDIAAGLFVFAATAVRFIGDERAGDPERRLNVILAGQKQGETDPLANLHRMYEEIVVEALRGCDTDTRRRFQDVVGAIVFAQQPPSINGLVKSYAGLDGCQYDADSIRTALAYLHSLIAIPEDDDKEDIHVYHKSFLDFITDPQRCTASLSSLSYHGRLFRLHASAIIAAVPEVEPDYYFEKDYSAHQFIVHEHLRPCMKHLGAFKSEYESTGPNRHGDSPTAKEMATGLLSALRELLEKIQDYVNGLPRAKTGLEAMRRTIIFNQLMSSTNDLARVAGLAGVEYDVSLCQL